MAARLTDKKKQKIIADYLDNQSYSATARMNGVTHQTVSRIIKESSEFSEKLQKKKADDTADILAYMDSKRDIVCEIIETGLRVLPDKIENARTASEVTTALGTLIDKFTMVRSLAEKTEDSGVIMMPEVNESAGTNSPDA